MTGKGDPACVGSNSGRQDKTETSGCAAEPLHDVLGERHALLAGNRDASLGLLARHAHRHALAQRGVGVAALGEVVHLLQEGLAAGESFRVQNLKEDIEPVDTESVAKALKGLPISRWKYKGDSVRHIGPMAQDFQEAFGVGDGKHIHLVDVMGVLLAGMKEMAVTRA